MSPPPLPHSSLASPPPRSVSSPRAGDRVLESFVSSSPSGQGSRGVHGSSLSLTLLVSSHGDEGAALWAVEEVRGSPGSTHSAAVCLFGVVQFIQVSLSLSVRVAFSCHLSPPLSLIPLSACFSHTLSHPLSSYSLSFSSSLTFSASPCLLHKAGIRYVSPFTYSQKKGICVSWLACLVSCFFPPPLSFASFSRAALCPWQGRLLRAPDSDRQSSEK